MYDVYDICMHDYMMMHDVVYLLYAMINVPLYIIINHLVCDTIDTSRNMHE